MIDNRRDAVLWPEFPFIRSIKKEKKESWISHEETRQAFSLFFLILTYKVTLFKIN
jgi:hypothetical protein